MAPATEYNEHTFARSLVLARVVGLGRLDDAGVRHDVALVGRDVVVKHALDGEAARARGEPLEAAEERVERPHNETELAALVRLLEGRRRHALGDAEVDYAEALGHGPLVVAAPVGRRLGRREERAADRLLHKGRGRHARKVVVAVGKLERHVEHHVLLVVDVALHLAGGALRREQLEDLRLGGVHRLALQGPLLEAHGQPHPVARGDDVLQGRLRLAAALLLLVHDRVREARGRAHGAGVLVLGVVLVAVPVRDRLLDRQEELALDLAGQRLGQLLELPVDALGHGVVAVVVVGARDDLAVLVDHERRRRLVAVGLHDAGHLAQVAEQLLVHLHREAALLHQAPEHPVVVVVLLGPLEHDVLARRGVVDHARHVEQLVLVHVVREGAGVLLAHHRPQRVFGSPTLRRDRRTQFLAGLYGRLRLVVVLGFAALGFGAAAGGRRFGLGGRVGVGALFAGLGRHGGRAGFLGVALAERGGQPPVKSRKVMN
ncbi:MAG: hypothetical protein CL844_03800 [Crocinitomicaceae bacterium]|nr:hypothetical protein [Crocinitomicaceae bacterium]